ncbi:MAG TPA: TIGR03960 family B12-binding radical SAM protein, partial [Thermodesulfovibrionales bacterium]|nr:TIGR03960 family B12-binding radical SAM protein [Thermodesulfovibrionales bacterium]
MDFCHFERPSRYINRELNALYKSAEVKVVLAFPDIYDVGMSHLGLKILYQVINNIPYASAERVFSPWLDMEAEMKTRGIPLTSLETRRQLRDFDIVGMSLQYELSYTTVLNMLSLAHIPLRAEARDNRDPLIIAGGPCMINPMPMSPFIDAFLIGDGEDAVKEIVDTYYLWKREGDGRKESLLLGLSRIPGVYVPSVHGTKGGVRITRQYRASLDDAPYPVSPVVPYAPIVHDRITIEVSRGCTMGCRFCQAGMIYRPLRERSPETVLRIAEDSLKNTGYEEISLTSLSAGDYSALLPLVRQMNRKFSQKVVSLSLPSLRVAAVNQEVLREIKMVRKTGFTIAPEAATERLRSVINKDFGEEDYERALHALFAEGWENLKLYFMIGLPTERDEDIEAIPEMALKAIRIAKKYSRRYVNLNVGISPFVPKPHTPMQWEGQEAIEKVKAKMSYLRQRLRKKGMNMKGHNPDMSLIEALFSRGDDRLSDLIERAWSLGCRLDAWTEAFDLKKWLDAAEYTGVNIHAHAEGSYGENDVLPWDGIESGVRKEFLWKEFQKALSCEMTADCRKMCHACGLKCTDVYKTPSPEAGCQGRTLEILPERRQQVPPAMRNHSLVPGKIRVRVLFSKTGDLRYLSHRELMTAIIRAMRRADIPVAYSQGFHPSPRVSFGPPLSVGMGGKREYFDMELRPGLRINGMRETLNGLLPEGLSVHDMRLIPEEEPSLQSF